MECAGGVLNGFENFLDWGGHEAVAGALVGALVDFLQAIKDGFVGEAAFRQPPLDTYVASVGGLPFRVGPRKCLPRRAHSDTSRCDCAYGGREARTRSSVITARRSLKA